MRFTLKNPRSLQYIDYQNVRKTEFLGCQSQDKKSAIESALGSLKEAVKNQNLSDIDRYTEELTKAWNAASEDMNRAAQAGAQQGPQPGPQGPQNGPDDQGPDEQ